MNSYQFFLKHAGYSHNPATETHMQGRIRCARQLAAAERWARDAGYSFSWDIDDYLSSEWIADNEDGGRNRSPWQTWCCIAHDANGKVQSILGGIDFGRDGKPWSDPYKRVVEAELASEVQS